MLNKKYFLGLIFFFGLFLTLSFAAPYTPPTYDDVDFDLCTGYTPPTYDSVNFTLGETDDCDTCTYSGSGTWAVNCADNCSITSTVDLGGDDITITGFGTFTTDSDIINYGDLIITGASSSNRCEVMCIGGCFKT